MGPPHDVSWNRYQLPQCAEPKWLGKMHKRCCATAGASGVELVPERHLRGDGAQGTAAHVTQHAAQRNLAEGEGGLELRGVGLTVPALPLGGRLHWLLRQVPTAAPHDLDSQLSHDSGAPHSKSAHRPGHSTSQQRRTAVTMPIPGAHRWDRGTSSVSWSSCGCCRALPSLSERPACDGACATAVDVPCSSRDGA